MVRPGIQSATMWNWFVRQWRDIRGNAKWWFIMVVIGGVVTLVKALPWHDLVGYLLVVIGLTGIIIGFVRRRQSARRIDSLSETGSTHVINFDHLPKNMLECGWILAYPKDASTKPQATLEEDAPVPGSVAIIAPAGHAYDYLLPQNAFPSTRMTFSAKLGNDTMIFVHLALASKDGQEKCRKWVKFSMAAGQAHPAPGYEDKEWTLPISGTLLAHGWRQFDLNLRDVTNKTWGKHGLVFQGVTMLRLRGGLQISPIRFHEVA